MRDYEFGNHLMMLRKSCGYSQFQLGTLVGVSDKAVSKWETGAAKPKYEILLKLASILKVDLNQLAEETDRPIQSENGEMRRKRKALWDEAERRLHSIYGENPPLEAAGRFAQEKNLLEKTDVIILFDILRQLTDLAKKHGTLLTPRGMTCGSFAAWLMGATAVNPLPAHAYCPACHRAVFHPEVKDGWDLPQTLCECGREMQGEGHDLPFEVCICGRTDSLLSVDCNMAPELHKDAWKCVLENVGGQYTLRRFKEPVLPRDGGPCYSLFLLPGGDHGTVKDIREVPEITPEEHWDAMMQFPSITLLPFGLEEGVLFSSDGHLPERADLLRPEIMMKALRNHTAKLRADEDLSEKSYPDPKAYAGGMNFEKYLSLLGSVMNSYTVRGPEELAEACGVGDFTELPMSREALWNLLFQASGRDYRAIGVISEIVHKIRTGDYARHMTAGDRALFQSLNLPAWFREYASNVLYLFPGSHLVSYGLELLIRTRHEMKSSR